MANEARFYDLDSVSLSLAGYPITGGFGEGGSISIKYNSDRFEHVVGRSGTVVRSKTNDKSATVEITLIQTAPENAVLAALAALDDNAPNGAGVGSFRCQDRNNLDLYTGSKAWISKLPEVEFARKATDRTWTITVADLESFPGGRV